MPQAIIRAQHYVADATCAIHDQLRSAFRGDARGCRDAHRRAAHATAAAIRAARVALGERPRSPHSAF